MGTASRIMYTIANIFNWIILICAVAGIVVSALQLGNVIKLPEELASLNGFLGAGSLVYSIIVIIVCIITILMVRKAKAKGTSHGWDILFIVLGVLDWNVFYILGGIFGVLSKD